MLPLGQVKFAVKSLRLAVIDQKVHYVRRQCVPERSVPYYVGRTQECRERYPEHVDVTARYLNVGEQQACCFYHVLFILSVKSCSGIFKYTSALCKG